MRLQLEAVLEARACQDWRQNEVPCSVTYGGTRRIPNQTKRRSLAAAPPIAQLVLVGFSNVVRLHAWSRIASSSRSIASVTGLPDLFSAVARAPYFTRTQDRDPAAALSGLLFPHRRGAQWYAARWSLGVIGLIMDGVRPARVADQIIDDLRKRERNGLIELPKRPALQPGDQVRILQGPFAGHLGLYAGSRAHERVLVLLALPGGHRRVELAKDDVEGVSR